MQNQIRLLLLALIALSTFACDEESASECPGGIIAMVVQVTDGDTVKVDLFAEKIRLLGIEAPETNFTNAAECPGVWEEMSLEDQSAYNQTCCYGDQSKAMLQFLLPQGTDICLVNPEGGDLVKGVYGRYLADIYLLDGTWINGKQVTGGYARANSGFPHPIRSEELKGLEGLGSLNGAGLWGYCASMEEGEGPCE